MEILEGTIIDTVLVAAGSVAGLFLKKISIARRIGKRLFQAFGIYIIVMGVQGVTLNQPFYFLLCLVIGTMIGEIADLDKRFASLGNLVQNLIPQQKQDGKMQGFVEASLLFCAGSMTFMGAMQSGIEHVHSIFITKGILDCISAVTVAMGMGISVSFSTITVFVYQGLLSVGASFLTPVLTAETISMCASLGNLGLVGIGINMLEGPVKIKVANLLPAMFIPLIWQALQVMFF